MALLSALDAGDVAAAAEHLREDAVWLGLDGRADGSEAVLARLASVAAQASGWDPEPQQSGAHGVLRPAGGRPGGALVVETRRGLIVLVAAA